MDFRNSFLQTSSETRSLIIALHYQGLSHREVAQRTGVSTTTVSRWVRRYKETESIKDNPRMGRPRRTTQQQDKVIADAVKANPLATATDIKKQLNIPCTPQTIRNRLHSIKLNRHPSRKEQENHEVTVLPATETSKSPRTEAQVEQAWEKEKETTSSYSVCPSSSLPSSAHHPKLPVGAVKRELDTDTETASTPSSTHSSISDLEEMDNKNLTQRRVGNNVIWIKSEPPDDPGGGRAGPSLAEDSFKVEVKEEAIEVMDDMETSSTTPTLKDTGAQENTHISLFRLIRDTLSSAADQQMTRAQLEATIEERHKSSTSVHLQADILPSAINFLMNGSSEVRFKPYIKYMRQLRTYQWTGEGRDGNTCMDLLAHYWLARRSSISSEWIQDNMGEDERVVDSVDNDEQQNLPVQEVDPLELEDLDHMPNPRATHPDWVGAKTLPVRHAVPHAFSSMVMPAASPIVGSMIKPTAIPMVMPTANPITGPMIKPTASPSPITGPTIKPMTRLMVKPTVSPIVSQTPRVGNISCPNTDTAEEIVLDSDSDLEHPGDDSDEPYKYSIPISYQPEPNDSESSIDSETEEAIESPSITSGESAVIDITSPSPIPEVKWNWVKGGNSSPQVFEFDRSKCGISDCVGLSEENSALDFFMYFFDKNIMSLIETETNMYYRFLKNRRGMFMPPYLKGWKDVTVGELYVFIGLCMLTQHVKKADVSEYWSMNPLLHSPVYSKVMSESRFRMIAQTLHLSDNSVASEDALWKVKPVYSYLRKKFSESLKPFRSLMIGESQVLFKGRLVFKYYIPTKNHTYEVKTYVLCDCKTGFILDFIFYSSKWKAASRDPHGTSGAIVKRLLQPHYYKGHKLFLGDWCSSPQLLHFLLTKKVSACGIFRPLQNGCPQFEAVARGRYLLYHANNVLAVKWHGRQNVHILSSAHDGKLVDATGNHHKNEASEEKSMQRSALSHHKVKASNEKNLKPSAVEDYNKNMKQFGRADAQIAFAEIQMVKWYKKLFYHMVDLAVLNAFTMYVIKTGNRPMYCTFHQQIVKQIFEKFGGKVETPRSEARSAKRKTPLRLSLSKGHFPKPLLKTKRDNKAAMRCYVCSSTKRKPQIWKETKYCCTVCEVPLCLTPCFEEYHTLKEY